jgi:hypothetical protein
MTDNLAKDFWDVVGEPADIMKDAQVGDIITLEVTNAAGNIIERKLIRVVKRMTSDKGEPQLQFQDVPVGTIKNTGLTLVVQR